MYIYLPIKIINNKLLTPIMSPHYYLRHLCTTHDEMVGSMYKQFYPLKMLQHTYQRNKISFSGQNPVQSGRIVYRMGEHDRHSLPIVRVLMRITLPA